LIGPGAAEPRSPGGQLTPTFSGAGSTSPQCCNFAALAALVVQLTTDNDRSKRSEVKVK